MKSVMYSLELDENELAIVMAFAEAGVAVMKTQIEACPEDTSILVQYENLAKKIKTLHDLCYEA